MSNADLIMHIEDNIVEIEEGINDLALQGIGKAGSAVGSLVSHLTSEKLAWRKAVKLHDAAILALKQRPKDKSLKLKEFRLRQKKELARKKYVVIRDKMSKKASDSSKRSAVATGNAAKSAAVTVKDGIKKKMISAKDAISNMSVPNPLRSVHNYVISNFHR